MDTHKWQSEWECIINQTIEKLKILIFKVPLPFSSWQRKVLYKIFSQSWHKKIALLSKSVLHFCICKSTWRTTTKPFSHIAGPSALTLEAAEKNAQGSLQMESKRNFSKKCHAHKFNRDSVAKKKIFCTPKNPTILAIGESSKQTLLY